jgi:hypothetical protein
MIPIKIEFDVDEDARLIFDDLTWGIVLYLAEVASRVADEDGGAEDENLTRCVDRARFDLGFDLPSSRGFHLAGPAWATTVGAKSSRSPGRGS